MKATEISEKIIQQMHCDWIKAQAEMLKTLLKYDDKTIIKKQNKGNFRY